MQPLFNFRYQRVGGIRFIRIGQTGRDFTGEIGTFELTHYAETVLAECHNYKYDTPEMAQAVRGFQTGFYLGYGQ